jgi:hypothetical protein
MSTPFNIPMSPVAHPSLNSVLRTILCFLLLVAGSGFYFFLNLVDDYLALDRNRDSFYPDLIPVFAFALLIIGAFIKLLSPLWRRQTNLARLICPFLFVVCSCTSIWFRPNLFFAADRVFLWANEGYLRMKVNPENLVSTVHIRSSVNFHKLIAYSSAHSIRNGRLSLAEIDALGTEFMGLRGCKIDSKYLNHDFYVLRTYC